MYIGRLGSRLVFSKRHGGCWANARVDVLHLNVVTLNRGHFFLGLVSIPSTTAFNLTAHAREKL